jgi:hypothetical protein
MIRHRIEAANANNKDIKGKVFHIFGLDILIDRKLKAWILELNDHPSLNIYHEKGFMNSKAKEESPIDELIKCKVGQDAIDLVCMKKKQRTDIDEYNEMQKCFDDNNLEGGGVTEFIDNTKLLMYKLQGINKWKY